MVFEPQAFGEWTLEAEYRDESMYLMAGNTYHGFKNITSGF
jgi:hypothetical protein